MAIQNRRGLKVDFDPNKMLPGEFAYALDTAELFYCYGVGNVKRLATIEDIEILLDTNETAYTALQQLIAELENETVLSGILADISNLQDNKLDKTGVSSNNTVIFSEASEDEDIVSGETHSTLFGKILKSIKDFRGKIFNLDNDLTTHKAESTTELIFIEEPFDQVSKTTVNLGYKPDLVEIKTVIRNSDYWSDGYIGKDFNGVIFQIGQSTSNKKDIQSSSRSVYLYQSASNYISGQGEITDSGFTISWHKTGTLPEASGTRRMFAIVHKHGKEGTI